MRSISIMKVIFVIMSILRLLRPEAVLSRDRRRHGRAALHGRFDYDYESRRPYGRLTPVPSVEKR